AVLAGEQLHREPVGVGDAPSIVRRPTRELELPLELEVGLRDVQRSTSGSSRRSWRTAPFQNASSAWVRNASSSDARNAGAISRVGSPARSASAVRRHM